MRLKYVKYHTRLRAANDLVEKKYRMLLKPKTVPHFVKKHQLYGTCQELRPIVWRVPQTEKEVVFWGPWEQPAQRPWGRNESWFLWEEKARRPVWLDSALNRKAVGDEVMEEERADHAGTCWPCSRFIFYSWWTRSHGRAQGRTAFIILECLWRGSLEGRLRGGGWLGICGK